jgi:hypothetical protein
MRIELEKPQGIGELNRRRFVALGATAAAAACVPGCRNMGSDQGQVRRPMRLIFTTQGRTAVLSIPAPWRVMAFMLAPRLEFHPFVHTAVPAGSWTVSPSLAASIDSQTAPGVKAAAVRVSA